MHPCIHASMHPCINKLSMAARASLFFVLFSPSIERCPIAFQLNAGKKGMRKPYPSGFPSISFKTLHTRVCAFEKGSSGGLSEEECGHRKTAVADLHSDARGGESGLSSRKSVQTVAYRMCLLATTVTYGLQFLFPSLQEAGLSFGGPDLSTALSYVTLGATVAACMLAPKASDGKELKTAVLVDGKVLAGAVATAISGQPQLGLAVLFVREIAYYGIAYKIEAAIGLAAVLLSLFSTTDTNGIVGHVWETATCFSLAILAFGKVFEPLAEDWVMNQSEFLAK